MSPVLFYDFLKSRTELAGRATLEVCKDIFFGIPSRVEKEPISLTTSFPSKYQQILATVHRYTQSLYAFGKVGIAFVKAHKKELSLGAAALITCIALPTVIQHFSTYSTQTFEIPYDSGCSVTPSIPPLTFNPKVLTTESFGLVAIKSAKEFTPKTNLKLIPKLIRQLPQLTQSTSRVALKSMSAKYDPLPLSVNLSASIQYQVIASRLLAIAGIGYLSLAGWMALIKDRPKVEAKLREVLSYNGRFYPVEMLESEGESCVIEKDKNSKYNCIFLENYILINDKAFAYNSNTKFNIKDFDGNLLHEKLHIHKINNDEYALFDQANTISIEIQQSLDLRVHEKENLEIHVDKANLKLNRDFRGFKIYRDEINTEYIEVGKNFYIFKKFNEENSFIIRDKKDDVEIYHQRLINLDNVVYEIDLEQKFKFSKDVCHGHVFSIQRNRSQEYQFINWNYCNFALEHTPEQQKEINARL